MAHLLFILVYLAHLVGGTSTNSTSAESCSPLDGTSRSVWSILGSCGLTLLICVWHALHIEVPNPGEKWTETWSRRLLVVLCSFFAPELVVGSACEEWCQAYRQVKTFREKGYEWSTTHSHFASMNGFAYRDADGGLTTIDADKFLEFCKEGKIANPLITEKEIRGWGKSDALGKAIFTLQLFWFILQVVVRGSKGLAITLVEIDTVCMAVLAVVYLLFWWDKPLRPESPHVLWYTREKKVYSARELSIAWKSEPSCWHALVSYFVCKRKAPPIADQEMTSLVGTDEPCLSEPGKLATFIENLNADYLYFSSYLLSWIILGGLHLVAWNFEFPTETEKTIWRVASLLLAGSSPILGIVVIYMTLTEPADWMGTIGRFVAVLMSVSAVISRMLLVGLMLASLRALPSSAYQTVSWTAYIPHL